LVKFVEETPGNEQRKNFGFPRARCHFQNVTRPVFIKHSAGNCAGCVKAQKVKLVACASDFVKPDDGFNRFALGEVIAESGKRAASVLDQMLCVKPVTKQIRRS